MTIDEIRKEERAKVYREVIEGIEQLAKVYEAGVPALSGHSINDEAKVAVPLLKSLAEGLRKQAV